MKEDLVCMTNEWLHEERKQIAELKLLRTRAVRKSISILSVITGCSVLFWCLLALAVGRASLMETILGFVFSVSCYLVALICS